MPSELLVAESSECDMHNWKSICTKGARNVLVLSGFSMYLALITVSVKMILKFFLRDGSRHEKGL